MGRRRTGSLDPEPSTGIYFAKVLEKGERVRYDLGTRDEATARRKLAELVARIDREERGAEAGAITPPFERAALDWIAARAAQGIASVASDRPLLERYAIRVIGKVLLRDVTAGHVRRALERAQGAGLARGTLVHLLAAIRAILKTGWQDGHAAENVALKVDVPDVKRVAKTRTVLTDEEIARFWISPAADLEMKLLGVVARVEGGMRTRDLVAWDWAHIDLGAFSWCLVPRTKTKKPQRLEVPLALRPALRAWWEAHGRPAEGPVFPVTRGPREGQRRGARNVSFADRLRRNLFAAGVVREPPLEVPARRAGTRTDRGRMARGTMPAPNPRDPLYFETEDTLPVDFHSFRRGFAQALDDAAEVSRKEAMKLTGHESEEAHLRYLTRANRGAEVLALPGSVVPALPPAPAAAGLTDETAPDIVRISSDATKTVAATGAYEACAQLPKLRVASSNLVSRSEDENDYGGLEEPPRRGPSPDDAQEGVADPAGIPLSSPIRPDIVRELTGLGESISSLSLGWDVLEADLLEAGDEGPEAGGGPGR